MNTINNKEYSLWNQVKKHKMGYFMLAPWLVLFLVFAVIPVIVNLFLGFTYFNGLQFPKWVGFDNYFKLLMNDDLFYVALRNSMIFALFTGPIAYFACLIFAWFLNELTPILRSIVTLIFYMPVLAGNLFMIWTLLFSGDMHGYLNSWLINLGFIAEPIQWLTDPTYMMTVVIIVQLWMSLGIGFLAFIAGLQGIDKTLYEASAVDGINNRFQELWFITLPMLKPVLILGAVLQVTASLGSSQVAIALTGTTGGTNYATYTLQAFMSDYGSTRLEIGYVAAIATMLSILMITLNKVIQRSLRKLGS
jgi:multiple sugar transport system permease protein